MDWLRACYEMPAVVERGGSPVVIRWYWCNDTGPMAPLGVVRSRTWLPDKTVDPDFGEVVGPKGPFVDGSPPPPVLSGCRRWPGIDVPCLGVIWPEALTLTASVTFGPPWDTLSVALTWDPVSETYEGFTPPSVLIDPPGIFWSIWPCGFLPDFPGLVLIVIYFNSLGTEFIAACRVFPGGLTQPKLDWGIVSDPGASLPNDPDFIFHVE